MNSAARLLERVPPAPTVGELLVRDDLHWFELCHPRSRQAGTALGGIYTRDGGKTVCIWTCTRCYLVGRTKFTSSRILEECGGRPFVLRDVFVRLPDAEAGSKPEHFLEVDVPYARRLLSLVAYGPMPVLAMPAEWSVVAEVQVI